MIRSFFVRGASTPDSAKSPGQMSGSHRRLPQIASKALLDINDLVATAKTSSCSREAGRAMVCIKGWVQKKKNLRPLFLVMDHEEAIAGIRKHAGEIILAIASENRGNDTGDTDYFRRTGDRMGAIIRVKEAIPELATLADSIIARKYKK